MALSYQDDETGRVYGSGSQLTVESGAAIDVESGGALKLAGTQVTANASELNTLDGVNASWVTYLCGAATITVNAEDSNAINVDVQLKDITGTNIARATVVYCYLSDDSGGDGICATAPDTDLTVGTNGTAIEELTADKSFIAITNATGQLDVDVAESSVDTWYLVVVPLNGGIPSVSGAITFA